MIRIIRAHFDGTVIVPDEPVDLPVDLPLRVELTAAPPDRKGADRTAIEDRLRRLAKATGCLSAPPIEPEWLRREHLYDERP